MAIQFQNVAEHDLSRGIDARSGENQINPGFAKDLLNTELIEKRIRKRPGYQGYSGNIPVRVTRIDADAGTGTLQLTLDNTTSLSTSVSLESVRSSPIILYGKSSSLTSGPITTSGNNAKYYPKFSIPIRKTLSAPSGTLNIAADEHGFGTTNVFCNVVQSLSLLNKSYDTVFMDSISQSESTFDINIGYTTHLDINAFIYFADKTPVLGQSFVAVLNHTGSGSESFSIPTSFHNLANFNVICQVQQDTGSSRIQVTPEEVLLATNGDVSVTLKTNSPATFYVILSAGPISNVISGSVNASSSGSIVIPAPDRPWVFPAIYLEQTPGGTKELVQADRISYSENTNEITIDFQNEDNLARNFIVFYEYGDIRSNRLSVEDPTVLVSGTDLKPQLTIWGLDHEEIYANKLEREGWANYIDSYRNSGEQRIITGLGGNLFSARTQQEVGSSYLLPTLFPFLFARVSLDRIIAPLFWNTGEAPGRTRGYITSDNSGLHWVRISQVEYIPSTGLTKYTLEVPNKQILDSLGTPTLLSSVLTEGELITIQQMSYAKHNGTFTIKSIQDGTNQIFISVSIPDNAVEYNDSNLAGSAGVFTDRISWLSTSPFIPGDKLTAVSLGSSFEVEAVTSLNTGTFVSGVTEKVEIPAGLLFNGSRISSLVPMRTGNPSSQPSTTNLVRGDMLSYTGIARQLRVNNINADQARTVSIVGDGVQAVVTLGSGNTEYLSLGQKILLLNAGIYTGEYSILDITSSTKFTISTTETVTVTGATLAGETVELDEQLSWKDTPSDGNKFTVETRWVPIEAPEDLFNLTPNTYTQHFATETYANQPYIRSTMVTDNMYLTNYLDAVHKFDGQSIHRAGLPAWQPGLFMHTEASASAKIVSDLKSIPYSAINVGLGRITINGSSINALAKGTQVKLAGSNQTYTIQDYGSDGATVSPVFYAFMDRALDGDVSATGNVSEIAVYRYYYRLNAVDVNDNVLASAASGSQDHVMEVTEDTAINHRLVGLPALDNYDYNRLEVQIYRTKKNQAAPFYLITTLPMQFNSDMGYVDYTDAFSDSDLTQLDLVNSALKGAELGINWSEPLRAKYITSLGNRTVLANLRGYPELDIQIVADATLSNSTLAGTSFLFRKDSDDTGTITDMVNRVRYQFRNGFSGTVNSFTSTSTSFSFDTSTPLTGGPGSWIYLTRNTTGGANRPLGLTGWWQIDSISGNTVTIVTSTPLSVAHHPNRYCVASDTKDVPVMLGVDGNLGMFNGDSFDIFDSMRRLSMAINASMRQTRLTLGGYAEFLPWMSARSGNDVSSAGKIIVKFPRVSQVVPEFIPTFSGYSLFVNQIQKTSGVSVVASQRSFPSRVIISYENYAEIFDSPETTLDIDSESALDINSADGQEITGIIPFFGEAAFGGSPQAGVLVVFKTNSIYLVDINQKTQGQNAVQRIETEGLGCTAPYSIAVTKGGIMFANEAGIYCLRRNQSIEYIGKFVERLWTDKVPLTRLNLIQGHHYGLGRTYKLSVPVNSEVAENGYVSNSEVYTYNHSQEEQGTSGSWTRYDNHPSTGWCNLNSDSFFSSSTGRVFSIRRTGTETDYRDDSKPILFQVRTRDMDFGNAGIRKVVDKATIHYRTRKPIEGTEVNYALDLEEEYSNTSPFIIESGSSNKNGIGDTVARTIDSIGHSLGRRRAVYFSMEVSNAEIDQPIEIVGIDVRVGGLDVFGIKEAAETTGKNSGKK